jgi:glucose/mannose-6-phosphate isomerase
MILDQPEKFAEIDIQNMMAEIDGLPEQLARAWELGAGLNLHYPDPIQAVCIAGMGGSAIGGSLIEAYAAPYAPVPVIVHRGYGLPAWADGPGTLVIASSHSGNTEETLSAFQTAVERRCQILAVTTGGTLADRAAERGTGLWTFEHAGQPRAAVGYSFGLLLAAFARLDLVPDPAQELEEALQAMRDQQTNLVAGQPIADNPAKRLAGQLVGRWVSIFGAEIMAPVARRWKGQINELAKSWAQFGEIPEADHNTLAGTLNPEEAILKTMTLFLKAEANHPRNRLRTELTKRSLMLEGLNTDFVPSRGETRLAQMWTSLHLGDYTAYYLAISYGVDPTPVEVLEDFKHELKDHPEEG